MNRWFPALVVVSLVSLKAFGSTEHDVRLIVSGIPSTKIVRSIQDNLRVSLVTETIEASCYKTGLYQGAVIALAEEISSYPEYAETSKSLHQLVLGISDFCTTSKTENGVAHKDLHAMGTRTKEIEEVLLKVEALIAVDQARKDELSKDPDQSKNSIQTFMQDVEKKANKLKEDALREGGKLKDSVNEVLRDNKIGIKF